MFRFGQNWKAYALNALSENQVEQSRNALAALLGQNDLTGKTFMDIGSGSGLHAVAASLLGASEIYALDIDPDCIEVTNYTIQRFLNQSNHIHVQRASILDTDTITKLPKVDIVYSWGVLHHTGKMYPAIQNASALVKDQGHFVIAIYNRHVTSPAWSVIKRSYNLASPVVRRMMYYLFYGVIYVAKWASTRKNPLRKDRGMDFGYDVVDWIGGFPYEYASIDEMVTFVTRLGFKLERAIPARVGTGCNEFVFVKSLS